MKVTKADLQAWLNTLPENAEVVADDAFVWDGTVALGVETAEGLDYVVEIPLSSGGEE